MKNIPLTFIVFLFLIISFPNLGLSQDIASDELSFEVNRVYPSIVISKEELKEAKSLSDLSRYYKPSWVSQFIAVEILTAHQGKTIKSISNNDALSQEQKDRLNSADTNSNIAVKVKYLPENNLKHNDPKEYNFTFAVAPDSDATFPSGQQQLRQYLKENAIANIPCTSFENYDLTAIKFTINEAGEIVNAHLFGQEYQNTSKEEINTLLLETVRDMPCWKPAEYADGTKVKQDFVLTVGNMENCMVNLLNIRKEGLAVE